MKRILVIEDSCDDMIASRELNCALPEDKEIRLQISYGGMPKMWNLRQFQLSGSIISRESVTMTSKTLAPVISGCATVKEDAPVVLNIDLNSSLIPVGTGTATRLADNADGTTSWRIVDTGTDRLFVYAGDFISTQLDTGAGDSITFCYSRKYQKRLENGAIELMEKAIQYCTAIYGSRSDSENFKIIQTTAFDFGGFAVDGISGMGESYFSDENLSDPAKGPASAEVLAHEIIHQWWGLGAMLSDTQDQDWNDEGITVYTTYRLMRQIVGETYAYENYVEKWENTMSDLAASFYRRHPEYMDRLPERYQYNILSSAAGANWYDGNALMIYRAAELIGEDKMDEIWAQLYAEGGSEQPPYISVNDFLVACGLQKGDVGRE